MPHLWRLKADHIAPIIAEKATPSAAVCKSQHGNAMSLLAVKSGIFQTMTQGRNINYQTVDKTANLIYRSRRGTSTLEINSSELFCRYR
jgi:hypothetical protein